jgi:hypothetical protein
VLTVDVHFGYDYNPEAAHITDPKALISWLGDRGFALKSGVYRSSTRSRTSRTRASPAARMRLAAASAMDA